MSRRPGTAVRALPTLFAVALAVFAAAAAGQASPEVEALRKDVEELRRELGAIRQVLEEMRRPAPRTAPAAGRSAPVKVEVDGGETLGRRDAQVVIVEYSDYQCPFCQRFVAATFPELKRDYIDTGKVRYVLRDFPLDSIHPDARRAAEAAHCAGDQGRHWEMRDALFRDIRQLQVEHLTQRARALGLDEARFTACLANGHHAARVNDGVVSGRALGVTATPSFFIGRPSPDGTVEATLLRGAQPVANFRKLIDAFLAGRNAN